MKVSNQVEFDAAVAAGDTPEISNNGTYNISAATALCIYGSSQPRVECYDSSQPRVVCYGSSQPRVECYDSSQPRVECSDSSQPRVVCYGSSQPRVECYDSSQPRVECSGSSQPRVVCYGSSQPRVVCSGSSQPRVECYESSQPRVVCYESSQPRVECYGSSQLSVFGHVAVKATPTNAIQTDGRATIEGGTVITQSKLTSSEAWCAAYGVSVADGTAVLFKAVGEDFKSPRGGDYTPGATPQAADWDGGEAECGGGLHFSPRPSAALMFNPGAERFVACPVALADMRSPASGDEMPSKIKARCCDGPVWECDFEGEPIIADRPAPGDTKR